ncbi:hypothetical protein [Streptomyces sp. NBC_01353]|uniref:hypothetical protein n=1 Tax=Streptomyces sp. NBC_01353 TaxID=2903835 RepID=UPI002E34C706|nr:hypothetical protein [Streptomyces sp. NBC_01353]
MSPTSQGSSGPGLTSYQQTLRERVLAAPQVAAPTPWRPVFEPCAAVGGLVGIGFGVDPVRGGDLVMVVSNDGHGLFDAGTGERIARDRDPDPEGELPDVPDLSCPGLGPLAGTRVPIAGLYGGGLHATASGGWSVEAVGPDWPNERVLLSTGGGRHRGAHGETWWHVFHSRWSELRAVGFSPSGRTLAVATSSDLTLWSRTGEA